MINHNNVIILAISPVNKRVQNLNEIKINNEMHIKI
jgi:hypothetical protein